MAHCWRTSVLIHEFLGWPIVVGDYDPEPEVEFPPRIYGHVWNLMPDGRIYDYTAHQFGLPSPYVTTTDNPHYQQDMVLYAL